MIESLADRNAVSGYRGVRLGGGNGVILIVIVIVLIVLILKS